ncbi:hypothetical protein M9194_05885 [Vibrio sp. S4M6]|uniref:hypothetical protein n=1 Tax=Vibrio sinus TaxID=2946865 RepID=UPI00202A3B85|nr:hypothetical protein [Vibrio sinus]MCL9780961.1 hypothetical protein [Vibrio sinus]
MYDKKKKQNLYQDFKTAQAASKQYEILVDVAGIGDDYGTPRGREKYMEQFKKAREKLGYHDQIVEEEKQARSSSKSQSFSSRVKSRMEFAYDLLQPICFAPLENYFS